MKEIPPLPPEVLAAARAAAEAQGLPVDELTMLAIPLDSAVELHDRAAEIVEELRVFTRGSISRSAMVIGFAALILADVGNTEAVQAGLRFSLKVWHEHFRPALHAARAFEEMLGMLKGAESAEETG